MAGVCFDGNQVACGMTDVGLVLFGGRSLDFAPVLAKARTGAALGMTVGMQHRFGRIDIEPDYLLPRLRSLRQASFDCAQDIQGSQDRFIQNDNE